MRRQDFKTEQNARRAFHFGNATLGPFRPELPQPTKWAQLLVKLDLNDSQALEAIRSDGERGEQIRKFVLRSLRLHFVPEPVIEAMYRRRREKRVAISSLIQQKAIDLNAVATNVDEQM